VIFVDLCRLQVDGAVHNRDVFFSGCNLEVLCFQCHTIDGFEHVQVTEFAQDLIQTDCRCADANNIFR
jgi:hypothetical protein